MALPFKDPDHDLNLNLGLCLIVISLLAKTKTGKPVLNNDRLHIYLYLIKNPSILRNVVALSGGVNVPLKELDTFSITSIAPNLDALFDVNLLRSLLIILASRKFLTAQYKNEGFYYSLSKEGEDALKSLSGKYFCEIKDLCRAMSSLQTKSISQVSAYINQNFQSGISNEK